MKRGRYTHWKFGFVLGTGALIALVLCIQCVRTYLYADAVLVPQQAQREAERQVGAITAAAHNVGIADARKLGPILQRSLEADADRFLWMRVVDLNSNVLAQAGRPERSAGLPLDWWDRIQKHESPSLSLDSTRGPALLFMLPLRMPRPQRSSMAESGEDGHGARPEPHGGPADGRRAAYVLEEAISLKAVAGGFAGLRENLILGLIASLALLGSLAVIALRAPHYLRGKYLESELQLAKRVQSDLQPKPRSGFPHVEFSACAASADHVGGDFYDIFEVDSGRVSIVLGDVSGKGVPAALLVSVLQGAIRSSTAPEHELACERINRMLCERTACERFATLFWGVFDCSTNTLRYVNAGHTAPMLVRHTGEGIEQLIEGGPVLGLLPNARYAAGTVQIEDGDKLIVYSDGMTEATDEHYEEFGITRLSEIALKNCHESSEQLCSRIAKQVTAFASPSTPQDDRTLIVVKLSGSEANVHGAKLSNIDAVAVS